MLITFTRRCFFVSCTQKESMRIELRIYRFMQIQEGHSFTHTLTHSLTHSLTHTHSHSHSHSHTHTHTHTHTNSLTHTLTLSLTHTHTLNHTLNHTLTHSPPPYTLPPPTLTHSLPHTHSLTHTPTHLSNNISLIFPPCTLIVRHPVSGVLGGAVDEAPIRSVGHSDVASGTHVSLQLKGLRLLSEPVRE
jgi:hypothetical protein